MEITYHGVVKWYDTQKQYGFVNASGFEEDILLHCNVLQDYGQNSVAQGAQIEFEVQETDRGFKIYKIIKITPPVFDIPDHSNEGGEVAPSHTIADVELVPARVKWYDPAKGFGFVNVFQKSEDVFIHTEVLRRSVFSSLMPGEAVSVHVSESDNGKVAILLEPWDAVLR